MAADKDWDFDLEDLKLDGIDLDDIHTDGLGDLSGLGADAADNTSADASAEELAAPLDAYIRNVEASWNRNLSTPISLDEDAKLYQPPVRAARPEPEPAPPAEPPEEPEEAPEPEGPDGEELVYEGAEDDTDRLPRFLRVMLYFVFVIVAAILLAAGTWLAAEDVLALTKPDRTVTVTVEEDDTLDDVAQTLYDNGLIEYKGLFKLYARLTGAMDTISPGEYELNNLYDYNALIDGMYSSSTQRETVTVTIPEGYECEGLFDLLEQYGVCSADELAETAANHDFDHDFLADLPYGETNRLEGYLFPDTYEFYVDEDPADVLGRFLSNFESKFDDEMLEQMEVLNDSIREALADKSEEEIEEHLMTMEKIVIIASLIEKEAAVSSERTTISSVIHNRLLSDLYPYLEIDATIQYILDERKDALSYSDLEIDSPYNTYLYEGLPAGPICNPGLSCLKAALYPAETNYYYYALNTDGVHEFFETSVEHSAFVNSDSYAGTSDSGTETDNETEADTASDTDEESDPDTEAGTDMETDGDTGESEEQTDE